MGSAGPPEEDVVVRWVVDAAREELAALALWDHGATAVEVRETPPGRATLVASYPTAAAARAVAARLGATAEAVPGGWRDAWRAHAAAVAVGEALVVAPAWRPVPVAGDRLVVEIDPGGCFGSGSHPSTRLLLGLLAGASRAPARPAGGLRVLDVGTGSGILAVVAARLGAASVAAIDVEAESVTVTERNARRNGVAAVVHASTTPLAGLPGPAGGFDLALVNVTAGVHAEVGAGVVAAVRPGGRLYLSGLLPGQWEHVAGAYAGTEVVGRDQLEGWVAYALERAGRPGAGADQPA